MKMYIGDKIRGSVLVAAVIFTALIAMMMMPVLQHFSQLSRMAGSSRASDQAFYAAEAGIARAMSLIFAQGGGQVTGIYDAKFAVDEGKDLAGRGRHRLEDPGRGPRDAAAGTLPHRHRDHPGRLVRAIRILQLRFRQLH
jgi:hypothetical protein